MRILKRAIAITIFLLVACLAGVYLYLRSTLPEYNGEITIAGLNDSVEIIRDSYGMPHIYARTNEDAYFALGYCMAQDRLFQMDMVRRTARGRLAACTSPIRSRRKT